MISSPFQPFDVLLSVTFPLFFPFSRFLPLGIYAGLLFLLFVFVFFLFRRNKGERKGARKASREEGKERKGLGREIEAKVTNKEKRARKNYCHEDANYGKRCAFQQGVRSKCCNSKRVQDVWKDEDYSDHKIKR